MNGSDYDDPDEVRMCRLENGVSLTIWEHQSTLCPNMPLRELFYFDEIIKEEVANRDLLSHSLVKIPTPQFVVFYNGTRSQPEEYELRLSDAFEKNIDEPQLWPVYRKQIFLRRWKS